MATVTCPKCQRKIPVSRDDDGKTIECAQCDTHFTVSRHARQSPPIRQPSAPPADQPSEPFSDLRDGDDPPSRYASDRWYYHAWHAFFLLVAALLTANLISFLAMKIYMEATVRSAIDDIQRATTTTGAQPTPGPRSSNAVRLTTQDFLHRFLTDHLAAERDLKGRQIEITGAVQSIGATFFVLATPLPPEPLPPATEDITAAFHNMNAAALAATSAPVRGIRCDGAAGRKLQPGQLVTVLGYYHGRDKDNRAQFQQCRIVSQ